MVKLKSPQEIEVMHAAGQILKRIIQKLVAYIAADKTTQEIDDYAAKLVVEENVIAAFKGYRGFPANICISLNEQVVHGIPSQRKIKNGDIVSLDMGIIHHGYYSDSAVTIPVGEVDSSLKKLIKVTRESLTKGIKQAKVNNHLGDIAHAIQNHVEVNGFSVVRQFVGHGIGRNLQEEPEVLNFGQPGQGLELQAGMVIAIEPMVNVGSWEVKVLEDNWTAVTRDQLPSAHFEHTVAITKNGPEVLT